MQFHQRLHQSETNAEATPALGCRPGELMKAVEYLRKQAGSDTPAVVLNAQNNLPGFLGRASGGCVRLGR